MIEELYAGKTDAKRKKITKKKIYDRYNQLHPKKKGERALSNKT